MFRDALYYVFVQAITLIQRDSLRHARSAMSTSAYAEARSTELSQTLKYEE